MLSSSNLQLYWKVSQRKDHSQKKKPTKRFGNYDIWKEMREKWTPVDCRGDREKASKSQRNEKAGETERFSTLGSGRKLTAWTLEGEIVVWKVFNGVISEHIVGTTRKCVVGKSVPGVRWHGFQPLALFTMWPSSSHNISKPWFSDQ